MDQQGVQAILKKIYAKPQKKLSQNFLINDAYLELIADSGRIEKKETILEIGPGLGFLSEKLLERCSNLILVEKDNKFYKYLKEKFKNKSVRIMNQDILKINLEKLLPKKYKVVSNIPYNITSKLIYLFLEANNNPKSIVFLVQKEVAKKATAEIPVINPLSLLIKILGKAEIIEYVNKESFYPKPEVDSAILKIELNDNRPNFKSNEIKNLIRTIKIGFSNPRKKITNNIASGFKIDKKKIEDMFFRLNLSKNTRAQEINLENWKKINTFLNK